MSSSSFTNSLGIAPSPSIKIGIIIIIIIIIVDFPTLALAEGLSLEFERKEVASRLQDPSHYFGSFLIML